LTLNFHKLQSWIILDNEVGKSSEVKEVNRFVLSPLLWLDKDVDRGKLEESFVGILLVEERVGHDCIDREIYGNKGLGKRVHRSPLDIYLKSALS
jgi:hypothetical protein